MKLIFIIFTLFFSYNTLANSPYIDSDFKKYDIIRNNEMNTIFDSCKKTKNRLLCEKEKFNTFDIEYPMRRTDNFCQKTYGNLTKKQADNILIKFSKIVSKARTGQPKKEGEITTDSIEYEAKRIQRNIFNRHYLPIEPLQLSTGKVLPFYTQIKF